MGFEWVPTHYSKVSEVPSYCRKIPERRFTNPDISLKRQEAREFQAIRKLLLKGPDPFEGGEEL